MTVLKEPMGQQDHKEQQDLKALKVQRGTQALRVTMVLKVLLGHKAMTVLKDI